MHVRGSRDEESSKVFYAYISLGGDREYLHSGPNALNVQAYGIKIAAGSFRQVQLSDYGNVGGIEDCRVFQRFIVAFGGRGEYEPKIFAEIKAGGADQVAAIFDEQKIKRVQLPADERTIDRVGIEVANRAGGDLFDPIC